MVIIASSLISAFTIDSAARILYSTTQTSATGKLKIKRNQKKKAPPLSCKNEALCLETGSRIDAAGLCWDCGNGGGYAAAAEGRQGGGLRHETDAPLSMTEMEVKYVLYDGNTGRDIKRRTAGERGGIMTLTSSKGRWSWRRRMHSLSIQMDLHTRDHTCNL